MSGGGILPLFVQCSIRYRMGVTADTKGYASGLLEEAHRQHPALFAAKDFTPEERMGDIRGRLRGGDGGAFYLYGCAVRYTGRSRRENLTGLMCL